LLARATQRIAAGLATLFGSWAPVPLMPGGGGRNVGQTKLWLWSKTPFEYTRRTSRSWDEWFTDEHSDYPCQMVIPEGWGFDNIAVNPNVPDPFRHPDEPGLAITQDTLNVMPADRRVLDPGTGAAITREFITRSELLRKKYRGQDSHQAASKIQLRAHRAHWTAVSLTQPIFRPSISAGTTEL
jgi:hypothetical protein